MYEEISQREKLTLLGAALGCTELAPQAGNLLRRAELFRQTCRRLTPELEQMLSTFQLLKKIPGREDVAPHDCIDELDRNLVCRFCGAKYEAVEIQS